MLPSNLLIARTWKGMIRPAFAYLNKSNLEVAEALVTLFNDHIGAKKGRLLEGAESYEGFGFDYRFVRGLTTLLERRCVFEVESDVDPLAARRRVFELASRDGIVTSAEARTRVLKEAAGELEVSLESLERSLWSDLDSELVLKHFDPVDAESLLRYYNLSLLQTLLFKAVNLSFTAQSNWKRILRGIKYLGLMYSIEHNYRRLQVVVDCPLSLLKLTSQYGTAIAKLVPAIVGGGDWQLQAEVVRGQSGERRILRLELNSRRDGSLVQSLEPRVAEEVVFDSSVEESFARRFQSLDTGWTLTREPEPLVAGNHIMLPDFGFEKNGVKAYLEIVGFWTPEYLRRKIEKLSQIRGENVIVAVDAELACAKLCELDAELIYYKRRVPLKPILTRLQELERRSIVSEVEGLKDLQLHVRGDVQSLDELAESLAASKEALSKVIEEQGIEGYRIIGNLVISEAKLAEIEEKIQNLQEPDLSDAIKVVEGEGIYEPYGILTALGYGIKWSGLDLNRSSIYKKGKR